MNNSLEDEAAIFGGYLEIFAIRHKLPRSLFNAPDHIVLQTADIDEFGRLVREEVVPRSKDALCVEDDWRFKVAAKLSGRVAVYNLGYVEWISVEEPKTAGGATSLERTEFYYDSLETARTVLGKRGIRSKITPEKDRAYISVQFDPDGSEFRLTDTPLSEIIEGQIESDEAVRVRLPRAKPKD